MSTAESSLGVASTTRDLPSHIAETGAELKRGAFLNTIAMLASNFRAVFTLLIARLLGPASLGIFSVAWATMDLFSKVGILGLDDAITTFIARAEALGDRARSRTLFRIAVVLAVVQSALVATLSIPAIRLFRQDLHLEPEMVSALVLILCALPGVALYRISNSVSRGMRVMKHDIYSRGLTEPGITTLAFLLALALGFKEFSPEVAAIVGTAASGLIAFVLASTLFRHLSKETGTVSFGGEARRLLGYGLPIGADQFLNAFIWRLDIMLLAWFVGRAPGVTLTTLGRLRCSGGRCQRLAKSQPVFHADFRSRRRRNDRHGRPRTRRRNLRAPRAMDALDFAAIGCGNGAGWKYDSAGFWACFPTRQQVAWHRRGRLCHQCIHQLGRNGHHGATARFKPC